MNIQEFITNPESKYAVITLESYMTDLTAHSLSNTPAVIKFQGTELVILSIPADRIAELAAYAEQAANGIEFELTLGTGKVTLLTHSAALLLVSQTEVESNS